MEQNNRETELLAQLEFMYQKYAELCNAYKKLAQSKSTEPVKEVHDMSHMSFTDSSKDDM